MLHTCCIWYLRLHTSCIWYLRVHLCCIWQLRVQTCCIWYYCYILLYVYVVFDISGFKHIFWSVIVCVAMGCAAIFLYRSRRKIRIWKILWGTVIIVIMIFLNSNTIDFMNATVVTTVDTMTVPLSEVFFPSVVVCNINQVILSSLSWWWWWWPW